MGLKGLLLWFLLIALSLFAYIESFAVHFLADDFGLVRASFHADLLQQLHNFYRPMGAEERAAAPTLWYRPVWSLSLFLDTHLWGARPAGFHATSLLLHVLNTWLLYRICLKYTGTVLYAVMAAVLFCCFPTNYEAVIWIAARSDLLCLFFQLLALNIIVRADGKLADRKRQLLALIPVWLALSTKEAALGLPFVVLLVMWAGSREGSQGAKGRLWESTKNTLRLGYPVMVLLAAYLLVRYLVLGTPLGGYVDTPPVLPDSMSAFLDERYSTLRPLLTPVWAGGEAGTPSLVMEVVSWVLLGLGLLAACLNGRLRWFLFCLLWLLASLVPLLPFWLAAEGQGNMRFLYSPAAPYSALLAFSLWQVCEACAHGSSARAGRGARVVAGSLALFLVILFLNLLSANQKPFLRAGEMSRTIATQGSKLLQQEPDVPKVLYDLPSGVDQAHLCLNAAAHMFEPPFGPRPRSPYQAYADDDYGRFIIEHVARIGIPDVAYYRYDLASESFVRVAAPRFVREKGSVVHDPERGFLWQPRGIPVRCPSRSLHDVVQRPVQVDALLVESRQGTVMLIARFVGS